MHRVVKNFHSDLFGRASVIVHRPVFGSRPTPLRWRMKPVFLTSAHYYLPGAKAGGPVRTIAIRVDRLGDEFDFRIGNLDRDAFDEAPYPEIRGNAWNDAGTSRMGRLE